MTPILVKELRPGKWYIVCHANGKRWVRKVANNQKEAESIRTGLELIRLKDGMNAINAFKVKGTASEITVNAYADKWIAEIKKTGLRPSTKDSYECHIKNHIKPFFGNLCLSDVTYSQVKKFIIEKTEATYSRYNKKKSKRRHYSRDTIRLMLRTLSAMIEEAIREELLNKNPVYKLGRFYSKAEKMHGKPDPFSIDELHKLEDLSGKWFPFLLFQARTGVRIGEAIALKWDDLDFVKNLALIQRTMPANRKIGEPKTTSSRRSVELSSQLVAVLKELQRTQREYWFSKGQEMPEWVFAKHNPSAPTYSVWRMAFILLQKKAKIRVRRIHDIRHTWASLMLAAGKPITWVSQQLGHKNPQVTLSIYAHWIPGEDHGDRDILDSSSLGKQQQTATKVIE